MSSGTGPVGPSAGSRPVRLPPPGRPCGGPTADVEAVQRMLGHAWAAMTLGRYADRDDDDRLDALRAASRGRVADSLRTEPIGPGVAAPTRPTPQVTPEPHTDTSDQSLPGPVTHHDRTPIKTPARHRGVPVPVGLDSSASGWWSSSRRGAVPQPRPGNPKFPTPALRPARCVARHPVRGRSVPPRSTRRSVTLWGVAANGGGSHCGVRCGRSRGPTWRPRRGFGRRAFA